MLLFLYHLWKVHAYLSAIIYYDKYKILSTLQKAPAATHTKNQFILNSLVEYEDYCI